MARSLRRRHVALAILAVTAQATRWPRRRQDDDGVLTNSAGMTLYTFDKDSDGKSACNGPCAANWPPLMAAADAKAGGDWRSSPATTAAGSGRTRASPSTCGPRTRSPATRPATASTASGTSSSNRGSPSARPPSPLPAALPHPDLVAAIPRLRRYARVLTGDPASADDLVQDALGRAWEKRALWQAGTDLRAWLFTIMHNLFVNQRALARREAGNVSLDAEGESDAAWQLPVRGNQLERVELMQVLQQVGRLPAEQREVLLLAAVEELRYEEIAAVLAIPVGTVMSRLSRARERLRRMAVEAPVPLKVVK